MPPQALASQIRRTVLQQSKRAHIGHIGSSLSIADLLAVLVDEGGLDLDRGEGRADRDRFVLGKGHAVLAWYCALHAVGRLGAEQLDTFAGDGTHLGGPPRARARRRRLLHGLAGPGAQHRDGRGARRAAAGSERRVVVLLSDAECNEGSVWEAIMFAAHHGLDNLTAIVDLNGQQALGYTKDVLDLSDMAARWRELRLGRCRGRRARLRRDRGGARRAARRRPRVLVAHTTFGKGVDYMQSRIEWHYMPMDDEQYASALEQVP